MIGQGGGDGEASERRRPRRVLPLRALIPNAITLSALCFGLSGVRLAITGEWEKAVLAIVIAGVLDGVDGRVARMLKADSRFGAELDSLSDVTAFGVAPSLVMYLWSLQYMPKVGWLFALSVAACCALRLARFNAQLDVEDQPHKRAGYLTGVPAPLGAGLALSPIFLDIWTTEMFGPGQATIFRSPPLVAVVVLGTALLMVSNLPTFSWGKLRIRPQWRLFALAGIALFAGALFTAPWMTLSITSIAYALSIPFSIQAYAKLRRRADNRAATAGPAVGGAPPVPAAEAPAAD